MTEDDVRRIVREELASLGGHLLSEYGTQRSLGATATHPLAILGGYLLGEYGPEEEA